MVIEAMEAERFLILSHPQVAEYMQRKASSRERWLSGIRRLRFTSPYPTDFTPRVLAALAETPAVCEHVHLPAQSGSSRTLKRMLRRYDRERYLEVVAALRRAVPGIALTRDFLPAHGADHFEFDRERPLRTLRGCVLDEVQMVVLQPFPD